jgi:uncharacterized protein YdhG (YjbR/CyaY superfamily)
VGGGAEEAAGEELRSSETPPANSRSLDCVRLAPLFARDDRDFWDGWDSAMKGKPAAKTVDEYLANTPEPAQSALKHIRAVIKSVVPKETTEVISYGMPMFKFNGMLVGYAAFKKHCSLFPTGSGVLDRFEKELKGYWTSKGTIQFTPEKPLPDALVKKIVKARVAENKEWD